MNLIIRTAAFRATAKTQKGVVVALLNHRKMIAISNQQIFRKQNISELHFIADSFA
jgi:hypothetical protein